MVIRVNDVAKNFYEEYARLNERDISNFSLVVNKLINVNYLTAYKEEDKSDYYFIYNNLECITNYFTLGGMTLNFYQDHKTFVLKSPFISKLSLNRTSSLILLLIRLLYIQKLKDISLTKLVIISMSDIQEKYEHFAIGKSERLNKKELDDALRIFKRNNILTYVGNNFQDDDFAITVFPTIQFAVSMDDVNSLAQRINLYLNKEDENEEVSED